VHPFGARVHGKLLAVDPRTDRVHGLGVSLPEISQVAIGR